MILVSKMCSKDSLRSKTKNFSQEIRYFFGESIRFEALIIKFQFFSRKIDNNWERETHSVLV